MTFYQAMKEIERGYYVNRGDKIVGCLRALNSSSDYLYIFKNTEGIEKDSYVTGYVPTLDDLKAKDWASYEGDSEEET